ncbi:MAG TPA: hypothetical protein VID73_05195 [Ktedonobacterales bacterium]
MPQQPGVPPQPGGYPGTSGGYPAQPGTYPGMPGGDPPRPGMYPGVPAARPPRPKWFIGAAGGAVALVLLCGICGIASLAARGGSGTDTGSSTTTNQLSSHTTATRAPAPTATATHVLQWTTVQQFSGTSAQKTPLFNVPQEWRIIWTCAKNNDFGGNFIVSVMNADGSPLDFAAINTQDNDGATTYEHQGDQQIYLDVNTFGEQWNIQVQVQR